MDAAFYGDNVVTPGTTLKAPHFAFGTGCGLVDADASLCAFRIQKSPCLDVVSLESIFFGLMAPVGLGKVLVFA